MVSRQLLRSHRRYNGLVRIYSSNASVSGHGSRASRIIPTKRRWPLDMTKRRKAGPTVIWNLVKHSSVSILDGGDHSDVAGFTLSDLVKLAARKDTKAA